MKKLYRNDLILLLAIILLCILIPSFLYLSDTGDKKTVIISHDGHEVCKMALADEGYFEVNGVSIEVKNMAARVTKSSCPDGLCMDMPEANNVGDSIICVPNRVSVKVVGSEIEEEIVVAS